MKWKRKDEKKKKIERKEDRKRYRKIENERKKDDSNDERKAEGRKQKERKEVNRDIIHIQNLTKCPKIIARSVHLIYYSGSGNNYGTPCISNL